MSTLPHISPNASRIAQRVESVPPSGSRRFFDISATMKNVISLGIGEPDFTTPRHILDVGILYCSKL